MSVADRFQLEIDRADIQAEIDEIRARADRRLEMPLVNAQRRTEALERDEQEIERLERLLEREV